MFIKHFVRMVTRDELNQDDIVTYFDIVQSVVPTKLVVGIDDENGKVAVDVIQYDSNDEDGDLFIYEIVLENQIDPDEGDVISDMLFDEFDDIEFTFEASIEM